MGNRYPTLFQSLQKSGINIKNGKEAEILKMHWRNNAVMACDDGVGAKIGVKKGRLTLRITSDN